jgi:hypothetical protein
MGARSSKRTSLGALTGEAETHDTIQAANYAEIIAGSPRLTSADDLFSKDLGKYVKLREALEQIRGEYQHIIIDKEINVMLMLYLPSMKCYREIIFLHPFYVFLF